VLNTIATTATAAYVAGAHGPMSVQALVHGYSVATGWGVGILVLGAVVSGVLINAGRPRPHPA
jgi:hypothetical protein